MRRISGFLVMLVVGVVSSLGAVTAADEARVAGQDARGAGQILWTRQFGTTTYDDGEGVAVDASGVYVVGSTGDALPGQTDHGNGDVFVRSYDHAGKHRWTRQFGTSEFDNGRAAAVYASGVYVVGYTYGAFPGQTNQGGCDVFMRSYDHAGKHLWTRQFDTGFADCSYGNFGVAVNASGAYVVGTVSGTLPGQTSQGLADVFVRSYTHAGKHRWTRQFGTGQTDWGRGVAVDASGVYIVGETTGAFPGWTNQGGGDVFMRSYDHAGKHRWTRQFGTSQAEWGRGVAVNASGVYVVGHTFGALPGQTDHGNGDVFVRSYDHAGRHRWTRQFGTTNGDDGYGVAVNTSGVYIVGETTGAFPGWTYHYSGDVFVRSYDHAGRHRWTRQFGTDFVDYGRGAVATASALYIVGTTCDALPGQTHRGWRDVFVRKYATG
jgi:hypothetical protein